MPNYSEKFGGKVAVVTGAGSGLGRELAMRLAMAGAVVIAVSCPAQPCLDLEAALRTFTSHSRVMHCDLAEVTEWESLLSQIEADHKGIDIIVNNAATDPPLHPSSAILTDYREILEINFFAAVAAVLAVLPGMLVRQCGIIVNVSSDLARIPIPDVGGYAASKAALSAFTESLSFIAGDQGVQFIALIRRGCQP